MATRFWYSNQLAGEENGLLQWMRWGRTLISTISTFKATGLQFTDVVAGEVSALPSSSACFPDVATMVTLKRLLAPPLGYRATRPTSICRFFGMPEKPTCNSGYIGQREQYMILPLQGWLRLASELPIGIRCRGRIRSHRSLEGLFAGGARRRDCSHSVRSSIAWT